MSDTMTKNGAHFDPNLIFEKGNNTLSAFSFGTVSDTADYLPKDVLRQSKLDMPNVSEVEVVRHFVELSGKNYGVDNGMYPLGSCTMKYNPKINEKISKLAAFNDMHPYSAESRVQGTLAVIHECGESLKEVTGMADLSFSPCAGAHGELTAMFIVKAYFRNKGEDRQIILVPDSAHGTNPASANVAGFKV
ncbi:MAG: aminomethyl-transferring glycine dehydrogenase subunit GcvPB, partial [Spirochaetales bacterium]|nr:aminomethyl-transferring glycine dehydrogenase subunit GcvPB [Spirochaetales bacterium]